MKKTNSGLAVKTHFQDKNKVVREIYDPVYIKGQLIPGPGHLVTNFFASIVCCNNRLTADISYASTSQRWYAALSNPFNLRSQDDDNSFCVCSPGCR